MFQRPTLLPLSKRSSSKISLTTHSPNSSQSLKINNSELNQLFDYNDEEIVIVEPTDPDEDRMKQAEETTLNDVLTNEQDEYIGDDDDDDDDNNVTDGDTMNSTDSPVATTESHIPMSIIKVDESTSNEIPVTIATDSAKSIGMLPLNDAIQTLLTCTPRAPTIQNVSLQPILPAKINTSGNVQSSCVVSSALPTLWVHSPVVNSTGISMPSVSSITDLTTNIAQNTNALNPLVAAVLVNCATVNMISQLAGTMCAPAVSNIIDVQAVPTL
ncbi:hypothetical protein MN116_007619 [Schistosoma mekongi]|uniref:Uncharacterized protein n=1 Tax=Schistosoma mekongi TaxID=38744 RepID=A0AAE1Z6F0_SCHME|nr:hypothetical protein MN116_007619 [Schistosoma mekongi]